MTISKRSNAKPLFFVLIYVIHLDLVHALESPISLHETMVAITERVTNDEPRHVFLRVTISLIGHWKSWNWTTFLNEFPRMWNKSLSILKYQHAFLWLCFIVSNFSVIYVCFLIALCLELNFIFLWIVYYSLYLSTYPVKFLGSWSLINNSIIVSLKKQTCSNVIIITITIRETEVKFSHPKKAWHAFR